MHDDDVITALEQLVHERATDEEGSADD